MILRQKYFEPEQVKIIYAQLQVDLVTFIHDFTSFIAEFSSKIRKMQLHIINLQNCLNSIDQRTISFACEVSLEKGTQSEEERVKTGFTS